VIKLNWRKWVRCECGFITLWLFRYEKSRKFSHTHTRLLAFAWTKNTCEIFVLNDTSK
jgi:hypothetical protein